MRLLSFRHEDSRHIGALKEGGILDLNALIPTLPTFLREVLAQDRMTEISAAVAQAQDAPLIALSDVELLPPIDNAEKIICIGRNYAAHAKEGGAETPTYPEIFLRTNGSLIADGDAIIRPVCSDKLDFEGELVVVMGKKARHVSKADALDYVGGYSIFNDATLRDYQRKSSQWTIGKNFDNTGAFGPYLVTPEEVPPGANNLTIQTRLNGELMQDATTADLVFPIAQLISMLSECLTLQPGDIIVTGTPSGVGYARTPPVWMKPGDVCEVTVEGIGTLSNPIVDEVAS